MTRDDAMKVYALMVTLGLAAMVFMGFSRADIERPRYTEIDVERINIVEPDGSLKLVISNSARQADTVIDGKVHAEGRQRPPGMIFFNSVGDEMGGLVFHGDENASGGGLLFDQFRQDQVIGLMHDEGLHNGQRLRRSGLIAWDRPEDLSIHEQVEHFEAAMAMPDPAERERALEQMRERGWLGAPRMFVGRGVEGDVGAVLQDGQGRPRLLMLVTPEGEARIDFLDARGEVVRSITPGAGDAASE